jgi:hypothetical protein
LVKKKTEKMERKEGKERNKREGKRERRSLYLPPQARCILRDIVALGSKLGSKEP